MKRPQVSFLPKHAEQMYKTFYDAGPSFAARHVFFPAIGLALGGKVDVRFTGEEAEDRIRSYSPDKIGRILISNHRSEKDAFRMAAGFRKAGLKGILNNAVVQTKVTEFYDTWHAPFIEAFGGIPVFRDKDMTPPHTYRGSEAAAAFKRRQAAIRRHLTDLCVHLLTDEGRNVVTFPQSTTEDRITLKPGQNMFDQEVLPFKPGVAYLALSSRPLSKAVDVVPMGVHHDDDDRTQLTFGMPFKPAEVIGDYPHNTAEARYAFLRAAEARVEECLTYRPRPLG